MPSVIRCGVVIGNGAAGAENQCRGLVQALLGPEGEGEEEEVEPVWEVLRIVRPDGGAFTSLLRALPVSWHTKLASWWSHADTPTTQHQGVTSYTDPHALATRIADLADQQQHEGPLLVVASGRDTVAAALEAKRIASDNIFLIQIQHPRCDVSHFDAVITPRHDWLKADGSLRWFVPHPSGNVILTEGSLHRVSKSALEKAKEQWRDEYGSLPKPLVTVCVGGPARSCSYGVELVEELVRVVGEVVRETGGSARITLSQRTPDALARRLHATLAECRGPQDIQVWDGRGPNPYLAMLAWSNRLIVTADSVNMVSEACSTGTPVCVIGANHATGKLRAFHERLTRRGATRVLTRESLVGEGWRYRGLEDVEEAAERVREMAKARGLRFGDC
eukprot:jgi/Chlat1/5554/Chrsp369S05400